MPPQQYQRPVLPPQGSMFQNPYLPPGQPDLPPERGHKRLLLVLLLLVLLGAGAAYYFLVFKKQEKPAGANQETSSSQETTPAATGNLRIGSYYYVSACNAFTEEDFTEATDLAPDASTIGTDFATNAYPDQQKKGSSLFSMCDRLENATGDTGPLSIEVSMSQYRSISEMSQQLNLLGLSNAKKDTTLNVPAKYAEPSLIMQVDNKIVTVLVQGYGDRNAAEIKELAHKAAAAVVSRLRQKDQKVLSELIYPATVDAPAFTYHNACALWGSADFAQLYSKADERDIQMRYATAITEAEETGSIDKSTKATCNIGSYTTDPAATTSKDYAYVEVDYYPVKEQAEAVYNSYMSTEPAVDGLGDKAAQQTDGLIVLSGSTLIRTKFKEHTGKAADQDKLTAMVQTILSRLQ